MAIKKEEAKQKTKQASNKIGKLSEATKSKIIAIDNTEHKALEENNAYLASFTELNTNPILELDREGNLKYQNPACKRIFPELTTFGLYHPFLADWEKLVKKLEVGNVVQPFIHEVSVGCLFYEQTYFAVSENQIRIYVRDITDRKKAEQALQASEENFRNSIENSPLGIRIVSEDGETLYTNHAILDIYGYDNIEEFKATPVRKRYTPESYVEFHTRREKRQRGEPIPDNYEISIVRKDGMVRHLQVIRKEVLWGGQRQYQTLYQDITIRKQMMTKINELIYQGITARKQMITKINELNDILRLVTNINQLIVGIDNEADLLQKTCDQLIASRQYLLAWIGFKQEGSYDILPSAQAGEGVDYLSSVKITWDDSRFGQEPTGTAIKTGKLSVMRDMLHGPRFEPWCEEARKMGLRSSVALPLFIGDKVIGTLTIYSASADAFNEKELDLLGELAGDLSLGIEKIRRREEHQRMEDALRHERDRVQTYLDVAGVMMVAMDTEGKVILVNRRACEILGYEANEIIGKNWFTHFIPDRMREEVLNISRRIFAGEIEPVKHYENQVLTRDGQERTIAWNNVELCDETGKIIGTLSSGEDITERQKAEEALKASEQNFHNSLDSSLMGIYIFDAEWQTFYANQAFLDIFGYENIDEVRASPPHEHYTPEEHARFLLRREKELHGEQNPDKWEVDIAHKDGTVRHLQVFQKDVFWNGKQQHQIIYNDITERKRAEEALIASEVSYRRLFESAKDGILIIDANTGLITDANPFLKDLLGLSLEEIKDRELWEIGTFSDIVSSKSRFQELLQKGYVRYEDLPLKTSDGRQISVEFVSNVYDVDHRKVIQCNVRDITGRKQIEEALKASEQNFRNSLDSSLIGINIIDSDFHTLYANQAFLDIFGYENIDESKISPTREHYTSESYADYLRRRERILHGEPIPDKVEVDIVRKDGAIRHLQIFRREVLWDGNQQYQILYNDITERKQIEDALKTSEEKYRDLYENAPAAYYSIGTDGLVKAANKAMQLLFGYSEEELIGKPRLELYAPENIAKAEMVFEKIKSGISLRDEEMIYRRKDGGRVYGLLSTTPMLDEKGHVNAIRSVIKDITERKQVEEEKQRLEEKAHVASRLAAVGEMAAGIAHEINNPLTGVLGFSQMMLEKENIPEELKDDLKLIADSSHRVADIVRRLLTFAHQAEPIKTLVNLNELIDNTLKLRDYVLKTANIEVVTRFDSELPWSVVDPGQLQQVFLNLIINAEQAMKEAHGRGTLTITTEKKENNILISFQDDGPGITKENLGRLFEPFFTTKAPGEGTGLGLSLSRSIVLEHGGKINVESESGHGATFIIELPIIESLPSEADALPAAAKGKPAITKNGSILVVDDEPGVRDFLEKVLTQIGYSVDTIDDAGKALDKLGDGATYGVILIDVRMSGMSGIELYSHILEKMPEMKNRIIFITGDVMGTDIRAFLTQNNLTYLAKPFDIEVLKEKINIIMMAGQPENDSSDRSGR